MNENKGVFGLSLLSWWDAEGSLDRVIEPLLARLQEGELRPVVAGAFSFDQAPDAHRFSAERRSVREGRSRFLIATGALWDRCDERRRALAASRRPLSWESLI